MGTYFKEGEMIEKKEDSTFVNLESRPHKDGDKIGKSAQNQVLAYVEERRKLKAKSYEKIAKRRVGY